MSAILSPCGAYRYRLEREVPRGMLEDEGVVYAYFGINCSVADASVNDATVKKWIGFTRANGGRRFIVGNPFAFRSTDVRALASCADPVGPDNAAHLAQIIADADLLVPCWGSRTKLPERLHAHLDALEALLRASGKPIRIFGLTKSGDPMHPLMLGYDTPLIEWPATKEPTA